MDGAVWAVVKATSLAGGAGLPCKGVTDAVLSAVPSVLPACFSLLSLLNSQDARGGRVWSDLIQHSGLCVVSCISSTLLPEGAALRERCRSLRHYEGEAWTRSEGPGSGTELRTVAVTTQGVEERLWRVEGVSVLEGGAVAEFALLAKPAVRSSALGLSPGRDLGLGQESLLTLELVAKAGMMGTRQADLQRALGIDGRASGYHVKRLRELGLVRVEGKVGTGEGALVTTNILVLASLPLHHTLKTEIESKKSIPLADAAKELAKRIVASLTDTPGRIMSEADLRSAVRALHKKKKNDDWALAKRTLIKEGTIELVNLRDAKGLHTCFHLVEPSDPVNGDDNDKTREGGSERVPPPVPSPSIAVEPVPSSSSSSSPLHPVENQRLMELMPLDNVYKILERSPQGISPQECADALDMKFTTGSAKEQFVNLLLRRYSLQKVRTIRDRQKTMLYRLPQVQGGPAAGNYTPLENFRPSRMRVGGASTSRGGGEFSNPSSAAGKNQHAGPHVDEEEPARTPSRSTSMKKMKEADIVFDVATERRRQIKEWLEEHKFLLVVEVLDRLRKFGVGEQKVAVIDRKTVMRLVDAMKVDGELNVMTSTAASPPLKGGEEGKKVVVPKTFFVLLHPSIPVENAPMQSVMELIKDWNVRIHGGKPGRGTATQGEGQSKRHFQKDDYASGQRCRAVDDEGLLRRLHEDNAKRRKKMKAKPPLQYEAAVEDDTNKNNRGEEGGGGMTTTGVNLGEDANASSCSPQPLYHLMVRARTLHTHAWNMYRCRRTHGDLNVQSVGGTTDANTVALPPITLSVACSSSGTMAPAFSATLEDIAHSMPMDTFCICTGVDAASTSSSSAGGGEAAEEGRIRSTPGGAALVQSGEVECRKKLVSVVVKKRLDAALNVLQDLGLGSFPSEDGEGKTFIFHAVGCVEEALDSLPLSPFTTCCRCESFDTRWARGRMPRRHTCFDFFSPDQLTDYWLTVECRSSRMTGPAFQQLFPFLNMEECLFNAFSSNANSGGSSGAWSDTTLSLKEVIVLRSVLQSKGLLDRKQTKSDAHIRETLSALADSISIDHFCIFLQYLKLQQGAEASGNGGRLVGMNPLTRGETSMPITVTESKRVVPAKTAKRAKGAKAAPPLPPPPPPPRPKTAAKRKSAPTQEAAPSVTKTKTQSQKKRKKKSSNDNNLDSKINSPQNGGAGKVVKASSSTKRKRRTEQDQVQKKDKEAVDTPFEAEIRKTIWSEAEDKLLLSAVFEYLVENPQAVEKKEWNHMKNLPASRSACKYRYRILQHRPALKRLVQQYLDLALQRQPRNRQGETEALDKFIKASREGVLAGNSNYPVLDTVVAQAAELATVVLLEKAMPTTNALMKEKGAGASSSSDKTSGKTPAEVQLESLSARDRAAAYKFLEEQGIVVKKGLQTRLATKWNVLDKKSLFSRNLKKQMVDAKSKLDAALLALPSSSSGGEEEEETPNENVYAPLVTMDRDEITGGDVAVLFGALASPNIALRISSAPPSDDGKDESFLGALCSHSLCEISVSHRRGFKEGPINEEEGKEKEGKEMDSLWEQQEYYQLIKEKVIEFVMSNPSNLNEVSEFIQSYSVLPPRLGQTILNRLAQDGLIKKKGNLYYSAHFGLVAASG